MPTTALQEAPTSVHTYSDLRREVKRILFEGRRALETLKIRTYWQAGTLILSHLHGREAKSDYGQRVIIRLARDLAFEKTFLYRILKFARAFPNGATWHHLTWSHYKALLGVENPNQRKRLHKDARDEKWSVLTLTDEIKKIRVVSQGGKNESQLLAEPKRETGRAFQVRVYQDHLAGRQIKVLDLGFHVYLFFGARKLNPFPTGSIVRWNETEQKFEPESRKSLLYTYKGTVERVVDGDTLRVQIDLGFKNMVRQYLRFAHINTAEIKTKPGQRARNFVKRTLGQTTEVEFRSNRRDKYDRYLSDVWAGGQYLNNALLREGFAVRVKLRNTT
jgi:endonuclease YncB( thermonuclease family)